MPKARLRLNARMTRDGATAHNSWEPLRRELQRYSLHLTVLGLDAQGHPSIKLVGTSESLRAWLDQAGYWCVEVE